jgi:hypothetical protein
MDFGLKAPYLFRQIHSFFWTVTMFNRNGE